MICFIPISLSSSRYHAVIMRHSLVHCFYMLCIVAGNLQYGIMMNSKDIGNTI